VIASLKKVPQAGQAETPMTLTLKHKRNTPANRRILFTHTQGHADAQNGAPARCCKHRTGAKG